MEQIELQSLPLIYFSPKDKATIWVSEYALEVPVRKHYLNKISVKGIDPVLIDRK